MDFVMDRNHTHWKRLKELKAKGWANLTASEKAEWNGEAAKGAYNCTDLNRVETAVAEIAPMFNLSLTTKTDWGIWDIPTVTQMDRYLGNVVAIRNAAFRVDNTSGLPELPDSMDFLTWETANNIEKTLYIASTLGGDTLTWDGKIDGRVVVDDYVKVSGVVPTLADFANGFTITIAGGAPATYTRDDLDEGPGYIKDPASDMVIITDTEVSSPLWGVEWPETGIYFDLTTGRKLLTIPGYTRFVSDPGSIGVTHDGEGNVTMTGVIASEVNGNVTLGGVTATDDGDGNITVK